MAAEVNPAGDAVVVSSQEALYAESGKRRVSRIM